MKIRLQVDWARRCKRKRVYHSKGFLQLLGCSWSEFTARVERQFRRRGWDWSDYGSEFTIDHQLPCCAFDLGKAEQRAMCSHFSNLQVLSVEQNRRKNGSYSKVELRCFKTLWRSRYGRKCRQLRLFKEQRCECPFRASAFSRALLALQTAWPCVAAFHAQSVSPGRACLICEGSLPDATAVTHRRFSSGSYSEENSGGFMPQPACSFIGQQNYANLRGSDAFRIHEVSVLIAGPQVVNQDTAPNANPDLLLAGSILSLATSGAGSGLYYLVNAITFPFQQKVAAGILMYPVDNDFRKRHRGNG
jgi:hypothetical protein